jgi:WD40 repeat protein
MTRTICILCLLSVGTPALWGQQLTLRRELVTRRYNVSAVVFSPDGKTLASRGDDNAIRVWNVANGRNTLTLKRRGGQAAMAFSPDGHTLAWGNANANVGIITLTNFAADQDNRVIRAPRDWPMPGATSGDWPASFYTLAFSPDGKILAAGRGDLSIGQVKLFDASRGKELRTLAGHRQVVYSLAFSPDGRTIATGSRDGTVRLWDTESGRCQKTLDGHASWIGSVVFSPDGKLLASAGYDKIVRLWDVASGTLTASLTGHTFGVRSLAFSPDGCLLASAQWSDPACIKLWHVASRKNVSTTTADDLRLYCLAFSPNGRLLASSGSSVKLWDVKPAAAK